MLSHIRKLVHRIREALQISELTRRINVLATQLEYIQADLLSIHYKDTDPKVKLITGHPVALESDDHKYPRGTATDSTRHPRLVMRLNGLYPGNRSYLDLGCAGGGCVFDFVKAGWRAVGLEGSDYSLKTQRAFWSIIPGCLFTCDITKPFDILDEQSHEIMKFSAIGAWEVLEHIEEGALPQVMENIKRHLAENGIFIASVATFEDFDSVTGARWHKTVKPKVWWLEMARMHGLCEAQNHLMCKDFPRGSGNPSAADWDASRDPSMGFHLILSHCIQ